MPLPETGFAYTADTAACRVAIRQGSLSFMAASKLLPLKVREPVYQLYAFCRTADDAVDLGHDPAAALDDLRERLEAIYAGCPFDESADRAFADIVHSHHIPMELPLALLEGLQWDIEGRRYETLDDVLDYATRVASTVGAMMCLIMKAESRETVARGCDLGLAMQLTNIARDVGEDARMGRIYLPLAWFEEEGIDPNGFLRAPEASPELARLIKRLLSKAKALYQQAAAGIPDLPSGCRLGIHAASMIYEDIGRVIAEADYNSVTQRARTSMWRKLYLAGQATIRPAGKQINRTLDVTPQTAFLLDAIDFENIKSPDQEGELSGQKSNVFDMFNRLGLKERAEASGTI